MNSKLIAIPSAAAAVLVAAAVAQASPVTVPNTFSGNTPASASQVNANFSAVKTAVDDNHARLSTLEARPAPRINCTIREIAQRSVVAGHDNTASDVYCAAGEFPTSPLAWGGQVWPDQVWPIGNLTAAGLRIWFFNGSGGTANVTPQVMCCKVQ